MANNGGSDPFQDDWGSDDDWGAGESKSDFDFKWNPDDDFSLPQGKKPSPSGWVAQQALWTKLVAGGGALLLVIFVFIQAGGITRLQMMGLFRESVSPTAACLNSGQVMVELALGLVNNASMRRAVDRANRLRSQRSGNPDVDEAMWSVANAVYKSSDAAKSVTAAFSFADLMAGDIVDRLNNPQIIAAGEAVAQATELLSVACEQIAEQPVQSLLQPEPADVPEPLPSVSESDIQAPSAMGTDIFTAPPDLEDLIRRTQNATVEISCISGVGFGGVDGGSGFVTDVSMLVGSISTEVLIVTNHHVIERCLADGEIVVTQREQSQTAQILGSDASNDLAILRVPRLSGGVISPSVDVQVGQWVMVSGFPQDVGQAVTFGQVTGRDPVDGWITADALVGPGNSGGPLVNSRGEVIGVVGAFFIQIEGISASVPIERLCANLLECQQ